MTEATKVTVNDLIRQVQALDTIEFLRFTESLNHITKKRISNNSRTHFAGTVYQIKQIEGVILKRTIAEVISDSKDSQLFGIKTIVTCKKINIMLPSKIYAYPIWLRYDGRDNTATLEIRDRDIWQLCKIDDNMLTWISHLERKTHE